MELSATLGLTMLGLALLAAFWRSARRPLPAGGLFPVSQRPLLGRQRGGLRAGRRLLVGDFFQPQYLQDILGKSATPQAR